MRFGKIGIAVAALGAIALGPLGMAVLSYDSLGDSDLVSADFGVTVDGALLEDVGIRLDAPPAGSIPRAVPQKQAIETGLAQVPVGSRVIDAGLATWRNLRPEPGPAPDGLLVWIVQVEEPGNPVGAGTDGSILDVGKPVPEYKDSSASR